MVRTYVFNLLVLLFFTTFTETIAQPSDIFLNPKVVKDTIVPTWTYSNVVGLDFNQVSFTNWNAGGINSISAILSGKTHANYKTSKLFWNSSLEMRYGINKQEGESFRKTDDAITLVSNFGYQSSKASDWFFSARFRFNTQFDKGYNDPNDDPISMFMAPAYLFLGAGMEYGRQIEKFSLYISPFTLKTTFVLNPDLANAGAFGVDPAIYDIDGNLLIEGKKVRAEFGFLITHQYQEEVMKNIRLRSLIRLYSDYLNNFGNVDIDWELNIDMRVNRYIKASLGSHIKYDHDIKSKTSVDEATNDEIVIEGAKLQWKQLLGIGVVLDLDEFTWRKKN